MTNQAQRTEWAVQQFFGFIENWTPPAALPAMQADIAHVRDTITAIAPGVAARGVGYGVFEQIPDRERECGFEHLAVSAVVETLAQAENAREYCVTKDSGGRKYFVICGIQQIPT